jgi:hypothetical protein
MGIFPEQFADIESVGTPWALASYNDRQARRHASTMDELQRFYDTVFPRAKAVLAYCDQFDIDDWPDEVKALMNMLYSLVLASFAVEVWKQPRVPDTGAAAFEAFDEPAV